MRKTSFLLSLLGAVTGLALGVGAQRALAHDTGTAAMQTANAPHKLVIGVVSDDPAKDLPKLQAMVGYLVDHLQAAGISGGDAVIATDAAQMVQLLQQGKVDVVSDTAFAAVHFATLAGAEPLLREWKKGKSEYHTILVTRPDTGIKSLDDLRGKVVAFEDPTSTSGFLYPLAALRERGFKVEPVTAGTKPAADTIGYVFADQELNIATAIQRGLADAGALNNISWDNPEEVPPAVKSQLSVFFEGEPLIRSVLLVRKDLDPALKSALQGVLTGMGDDAAAKDVLKKYFKVAKYDPIAGVAADSLAHVRALYPTVSGEIR